jgi:sugar lactone lactonase YvrE
MLLALVSLVFTATASAQVTYGGIQSNITGPGGSWSGPVGVASDTSGNIYVGQYNSIAGAWSVIKVNASTHATSTYITGTVSCGGTNVILTSPQLIVNDAANNLYIANQGTNQIMVWSTTSNTCTKYYGAPGVFSIALDSAGDIFYGSTGVIGKITAGAANGTAGTSIITSGITYANGLAIAPAAVGGLAVGDLLATDSTSGTLNRYTLASGYSSASKTTLATGLTNPYGLMFDSSNNLYVAVGGLNEVVKYASSSNYATQIPVIPYALNAEGIGQDPSGNLYFTAYVGGVVTELCTSGACVSPTVNIGSSSSNISVNFQIASGTTVSGFAYLDQGISGTTSEFNAPSSDSNTSLCTAKTYSAATVCDVDFAFKPTYPGYRYGAIQVLGSSSAILSSVFVGGIGVGPELAFSPAVQSTVGTSLTTPQGVFVDGFDNVYITDTVTSTGSIQKVTSGGVQSTIPISGVAALSNPGGVFVDGAGNIYIADYSTSRVVKVPWNSATSTYGTATTLGTGISTPNDVAVDGNGNVYIANEGANTVVKIPWNGTAYGTQINLPSPSPAFSGLSPTGVAVDGNLNVYAADYHGNAVWKYVWNGTGYNTAVTVGSGLLNPFNVSVDANGNVYIADYGNRRVVVEPWSGSSYGTQTVVATVANNGLATPTGVSVDGNGNVYIADQGNNRILKLSNSTGAALTFKTATNIGSADSTDDPQSFTIVNVGNAPLSITVPSSGSNPSIASGFSYDASSTCPDVLSTGSAGTITQGASCTYAVDFIPTAAGTNSGSLILSDNNLYKSGGATQTVSLTGTGLQITPTLTWTPVAPTGGTVTGTGTSTLATIPYLTPLGTLLNASTGSVTSTCTYTATPSGQAVTSATANLTVGSYTLTATCVPSNTSLYTTTTSTISLKVTQLTPTITWATPASITYGTALSTTQLNATASVAGTSFVYTPAAGTILTPGSHTLSVLFTPTDTVDYTTATATVSINVTQATPVATLTATPNPIFVLNPVTVKVTLPAIGGGAVPTGTVNFFDGSTQLNTTAVALVSGSASLTFNPTVTGTHTLTAVYSGDTNYLTATSNAVAEVVADFTITAVTSPTTILPGGIATYTVTLTPLITPTFPAAITLTTTGGPSTEALTLSSTTAAAGAGVTNITMTVAVPSTIVENRNQKNPWQRVAPVSLALLLLPFLGKMRRKLSSAVRLAILMAVGFAAVAGMSGCGNNPSGYFGQQPKTFIITVTGTSGLLSHSTNVSLTVE